MTTAGVERVELCDAIERRLLALPENNDKGKLRGLFLRLRQARQDDELFEAEFQKMAALSEKVAQETPAARLHELLSRR